MQKRFKFQLNTTYNYQFDQYYNCFNNYERPFYINARILIKIFKEIEYANIHRVVLSKDKSFETMLLKTCFSDYLTIQKLEEMIHNKEIANPELVQKLLRIIINLFIKIPLERYARINAIKECSKFLKGLKQQFLIYINLKRPHLLKKCFLDIFIEVLKLLRLHRNI